MICNSDTEYEHTLGQEFMQHVYKHEHCWFWTGTAKWPEGSAHGSPRGYCYKSLNGDIPKDKYLDTLCGNKKCVNPEHLSLSDKLLWSQRKKLHPNKQKQVNGAFRARQKDNYHILSALGLNFCNFCGATSNLCSNCIIPPSWLGITNYEGGVPMLGEGYDRFTLSCIENYQILCVDCKAAKDSFVAKLANEYKSPPFDTSKDYVKIVQNFCDNLQQKREENTNGQDNHYD
jgi:hypothetical protein